MENDTQPSKEQNLLNNERITEVASAITQLLIVSRVSQAEAVYAMIIGATMRLALDCDTIEELMMKVKGAGRLFEMYGPTNTELFKRAIEAAKKQREAGNEDSR